MLDCTVACEIFTEPTEAAELTCEHPVSNSAAEIAAIEITFLTLNCLSTLVLIR